MADRKYITIMFVPDSGERPRSYRLRQWVLRAGMIGGVVLVLGIIGFFASYSTILARAAMTDQLRAENERLKRYYYKVQLLEENLNQTREIVARLIKLAGIDIELPAIPDDSTLFAAMDEQRPAVVVRSSTADPDMPSGLPVQGFISQDFSIDDPDHFHPGVDIACAEGTPVLATAAGTVEYADFDSTYGYMVVLRHSDSVTTIYGHNDSLLVAADQEVPAGGRIALSGNTGKSTAPHLHYELRINDQPINPLETLP